MSQHSFASTGLSTISISGIASSRGWNSGAPLSATTNAATATPDRRPGPYTRDDLAGDAIAVLDHLDVDRAILVGHSMGGIMAMSAALRHPDRVSALVLIGTTSQTNEKSAAWYEKIAEAGFAEGVAGLARTIYGPDANRAIRGDAVGISEVTRTLGQLYPDPLTPYLGGVACPALLIVGEHDPLGARATEICAEALPDATVEYIDDVGHWVHRQAPDRILSALDRWRLNERSST